MVLTSFWVGARTSSAIPSHVASLTKRLHNQLRLPASCNKGLLLTDKTTFHILPHNLMELSLKNARKNFNNVHTCCHRNNFPFFFRRRGHNLARNYRF